MTSLQAYACNDVMWMWMKY